MERASEQEIVENLKMEVSLVRVILKFLMALQKKDYKRAMVLWRDLNKRLPNDPVIGGFAEILPEEARAQDSEESGSEYESEDDENDEDYDEEEEKESSSGESTDPEERKAEEERKAKELEELGDPGEGYEWASDVDSEGRPIWGEEGVDYEWYYEEDRQAWLRGEKYVGHDLLNKNQQFKASTEYTREQAEIDRKKFAAGVKAKLAEDEQPGRPLLSAVQGVFEVYLRCIGGG